MRLSEILRSLSAVVLIPTDDGFGLLFRNVWQDPGDCDGTEHDWALRGVMLSKDGCGDGI